MGTAEPIVIKQMFRRKATRADVSLALGLMFRGPMKRLFPDQRQITGDISRESLLSRG
jgi:hypothetical protein